MNKNNLVHISKMTGKLEGLKAISTNTITNNFCLKMNKVKSNNIICKYCYSHSMLNTYRKNMQECLQRNSNLLSTKELKDNQIPFINELYIRINAHGVLINEMHLHNIVLICNKYKRTNFALWSKRKDIVKKYFDNNKKPTNLILVYSNPKINNIIDENNIPKYFNKTFNNVSHDKFKDKQNCTGQQCKDCFKCYEFNNINTIVEAVKINGRLDKNI